VFDMKRRDFITLLGGAAAWPVAARAAAGDAGFNHLVVNLAPAPRRLNQPASESSPFLGGGISGFCVSRSSPYQRLR
jgi:hypothetical protein